MSVIPAVPMMPEFLITVNELQIHRHILHHHNGLPLIQPTSLLSIASFRKNSKELIAASRKDFNRYFSSYRVRAEHLFGIMKEKLPSMKKLNIRITNAKSHELACTWIRVCCILLNILLPLYDKEDLQCTNFSQNREESNER